MSLKGIFCLWPLPVCLSASLMAMRWATLLYYLFSAIKFYWAQTGQEARESSDHRLKPLTLWAKKNTSPLGVFILLFPGPLKDPAKPELLCQIWTAWLLISSTSPKCSHFGKEILFNTLYHEIQSEIDGHNFIKSIFHIMITFCNIISLHNTLNEKGKVEILGNLSTCI
jgi:hypothetical protein